MKKFWQIAGWAVVISFQIGTSFLLVEIFQRFFYPVEINTAGQFLIIPLLIWVSFMIGIYGVGILGLLLRKSEKLQALLRLASTAFMALLPMLLLIFLGLSAGIENEQAFDEIVLGRMVPYYTQLNVVFSLLGFYIPSWFKKFKNENR